MVSVAVPAPLKKALYDESWPLKAARFAAGILFGLFFLKWFFKMSWNEVVNGISLGSLYGLIAVGIILIYRTNRIINFAAVAAGAVPAIFALLLDVQRHIN